MKSTGLDVRCYVVGYDISGDANALNDIGNGTEMYEVTGLNKSAIERIGGRVSGQCTVNSWFDNATGQQHDAFLESNVLPSADRLVLIPMGAAIGDACAMLNAKQSSYEVSNPSGGAMAASAEFQSDDYGVEFGVMLTAHDDTHASANQNSSIDDSAARSEWDWQPTYDLATMTADMIDKLRKKIGASV